MFMLGARYGEIRLANLSAWAKLRQAGAAMAAASSPGRRGWSTFARTIGTTRLRAIISLAYEQPTHQEPLKSFISTFGGSLLIRYAMHPTAFTRPSGNGRAVSGDQAPEPQLTRPETGFKNREIVSLLPSYWPQ